jgi:hypothetical protein
LSKTKFFSFATSKNLLGEREESFFSSRRNWQISYPNINMMMSSTPFSVTHSSAKRKWTEKDLEDNKFPSIGLIRSTTKMDAKIKLHFGMSIHLKILLFLLRREG